MIYFSAATSTERKLRGQVTIKSFSYGSTRKLDF